MRERLRIGEVAKLLGLTPKAVRHYEELGLLDDPERSESGYRLYGADDLLRLQRIKRLRSLGLSLKRVKTVLGTQDQEKSLESILAALLAEVEAEMRRLAERRARILALLAGEEEATPSPTFEKAVGLLGEHLDGVSEAALEQEKKLWATLDAFEWPAGFDEGHEELFRYYAERPEEYKKMLVVGERLAALGDAAEDDPEVERVADELLRFFRENPLPEGFSERAPFKEGPVENALNGVMMAGYSPAQRRVFEILNERITGSEDEGPRETEPGAGRMGGA